MTQTPKYTPADLRYAATARCPCGAGFAYPLNAGIRGEWTCSEILIGAADANATHDGPLPFAFYEIKSEDQPSANGRTTRPIEDEAATRARTIALLRDEMRRADSIDLSIEAKQVKLKLEREEWREKRRAAVEKLAELGVTGPAEGLSEDPTHAE